MCTFDIYFQLIAFTRVSGTFQRKGECRWQEYSLPNKFRVPSS